MSDQEGLADHLCVNEGDVNVIHSCEGGILQLLRKYMKNKNILQ